MFRFSVPVTRYLNNAAENQYSVSQLIFNHARRLFSSKEARKTCLYDLHVEQQGKIVNFAGWLMPVQYREAIAASHQHTRTFASLFDVGHMLQTRIIGKDATEFLESLTTSDLKNLAQGSAVLTIFTNDTGGILDDLIITKDQDDQYFVVSNAGRRKEDSQLLLEKKVGTHLARRLRGWTLSDLHPLGGSRYISRVFRMKVFPPDQLLRNDLLCKSAMSETVLRNRLVDVDVLLDVQDV